MLRSAVCRSRSSIGEMVGVGKKMHTVLMDQELVKCCIQDLKSVKLLLKSLGFGFLFVWILFGSYHTRTESRPQVATYSLSVLSMSGAGRRLLALGSDTCNNETFEDCEVRVELWILEEG